MIQVAAFIPKDSVRRFFSIKRIIFLKNIAVCLIVKKFISLIT